MKLLKTVSWHLLGLYLSLGGAWLFLGGVGFDPTRGNWGLGLILMGVGVWAWIRGMQARRVLIRKNIRKDLYS